MIETRSQDIFHKSQLNRVLIEIVDDAQLLQALAFKGGTCAAMLGYLDRFSVDLDFDLVTQGNTLQLRNGFHEIFSRLGMVITLEFDKALFFQLRYPNKPGLRSTLKISVNDLVVNANRYQVQYFPEIDRLVNCQTIETMFANKLVAVVDRYTQHQTIAGRDIYDIHHFFIRGYTYDGNVIRERTRLEPVEYLKTLRAFIKTRVNQTLINEDLNSLLPDRHFQVVRKVLLPETISILETEISKYS
jgi:predicted nucleotidyltransferase component of viral defense system